MFFAYSVYETTEPADNVTRLFNLEDFLNNLPEGEFVEQVFLADRTPSGKSFFIVITSDDQTIG